MDGSGRSNPFPGLRPFAKEEADLFFGRDKQSDELVQRLASRRFLAVVGTSGSGKSSLVRAGLLPSLEGGFMAEAGAHWRIAILRPQDDPIRFLAHSIVDSGVLSHLSLARPAAEDVAETTLRRSSLGLVEAVRLGRLEIHENVLIVVDQFEEIFRFADLAKHRDAGDDAPAFVNLLLEAASQREVPMYVVITMRSDFLGDCARFRHLAEDVSDSQYLIPRLTRDELHAVITGPIGVRGGRITPSVVQYLLNDIGDDMDQLPVLQHALMRTWEHWERNEPEGRSIDLGDLTAIGGMEEALSRHADEAFESLATDWERKIAERAFKCLTERGPDNREIRRPTPVARIATIASADTSEVIRVLDVFRAPGRSFLMPPGDVELEGESVIDISHESLIRQWGRLRAWVEEESESRTTYLRLVDAARLRHAGRGGLWGEPDLTYAQQWQEREAPNAAWAERYAPGFDAAGAFLRDSEAAHAAAAAQERLRVEAERIAKERELEQAKALAEAQRQRAEEQVRNARRLKRFLWSAVAAASCAAALAVVALVLFFSMRRARDASRELSAIADAQRLATVSMSLSSQYPQRALLLAAEAVAATRADAIKARGLRLPDAEQALRDVLRMSSGIALHGLPGGYQPMAVSSDSHWLIVGSATGPCHLVDLKTKSPRKASALLLGHHDRIHSLAISSDSRWLVTGSADRTARLWDLKNPKPGETAIALRGHKDRITAVAISADGRWIATGSADSTVRLWKSAADDPDNYYEMRLDDNLITALAFTPDGRWFATASQRAGAFGNGDVRLWDLAASDPSAQSQMLLKEGDRIGAITISPGRRWLVAEGHFGGYVWDLSSPDPARTRREVGTSIAISHNDRWLVSAQEFPNGEAYLADLTASDAFRTSRVLRGHNPTPRFGGSRDFVFSPDSRWLVTTGDDDQNALLWNLTAADPASGPVTLRGHRNAIWGAAISPDSRSLVTSARDESTALMWDLTDPSAPPRALRGSDSPVGQLRFTPDGHWLIARGLSDDFGHLWDLANPDASAGEIVVQAPPETAEELVAISPDNRWLVTTTATSARLWNVSPNANPAVDLEHGHSIWSMAVSSDSRWLATGDHDGRARLWDVASRREEPARVLHGHSDLVRSIAISADAHWLATGSDDETVRLWDLSIPDPEKASIVLPGHGGWIDLLAFSADNRWLITVELHGPARLWDLSALNPADPAKASRILKGHSRIKSVAISPDSRWVATGSSDHTVNLWDLRSREPATPIVLRGHEGSVVALAFTRDGHWLATACGQREEQEEGGSTISGYPGDRTARLWDLSAADPSKTAVVLRGHEADLSSVAVSGDGRWLATGSEDSTVRVWDLAATNPSQSSIVLRGHERKVVAVAAGPDNSLLTWSSDRTARRWTLDQAGLLSQAHEIAGRNLSSQEWNRYFPGQAYRKTFDDLPLHPSVVADVANVSVQNGVDAGLRQLPPALHAEARSASVEFLIRKAKNIAAEGDYDRGLTQLRNADLIQPGLSTSSTLDEIKRIAAGAFLSKSKDAIMRQALPKVPESLSLLRKAIELDPGLPLHEGDVRELATRRFIGLARERLDALAVSEAASIEAAELLIKEASAFNPDLGIHADFIALQTRVAIVRRLRDVRPEWDKLLASGKIADALSSYTRFEALSPGDSVPANDWNRLCWFGSLHGAASMVRGACDKAVVMNDHYSYRDSRGLARALTGDRAGAIADWRYFVEHATGPNSEKKQRQEWIALLQSGGRFVLTEELRALLLKQ